MSTQWTPEAGRYTRGKNLLGDIVFCLFRSLDVPLQYYFLHRFSTPPSGASATTFIGLSPYNTAILSLMAGSSIRHIFWKLYTSEQVVTPSFAVTVGVFNTVNNSINTLMSIWSLTSMAPGPGEAVLASPIRILGMVLFLLGTSVETFAERGRSAFKAYPKNKGKLYTGGFFGLARHVNFGSYLLWRSGLATFCGGLTYGAIIASLFVFYFTAAGIPPLDKYMGERVCGALISL